MVTPLRSQQDDCREQALAVSVLNKHGQFVPALQSTNFRAKIHGEELKVLSAQSNSSAHRVAIVLDASGSMQTEIHSKTLQTVSAEIIRSLPEKTQVAMVVFTDRVLETVQFGHSREELLWAVDHLVLPGKDGTSLRDALLYATTLFGQAQPGDSVVVLTDGQDNKSKTSAKALENTFRLAGHRMFFIRLYDPSSRTLDPMAPRAVRPEGNAEDFESLVGSIGGAVLRLELPDSKSMAAVADSVAGQAAHYYLLRLAVPESVESPTSFKVEVVEPSGKKMKDIGPILPGKLRPCSLTATAR